MPLYDYRCPQCGAEFERLVKFSKADEITCPDCKYAYAQRRISRVAVQMNGDAGSSWSDSRTCGGSVSPGGG